MSTSKNSSEIKLYDIENLIPFTNHPFKLYKGERFADMIESIGTNGVIVPIIIRPYAGKEYRYEILSGHNRVEAARIAGVKEIPAICKYDLTEEEAMLIVTETNLYQRSFSDLTHSERAAVLTVQYEVMKKKPGYRPHLQAEIEEMSGAPVGHRVRTRDKLGEEFGLGKTTITRYLHINRLVPVLKELLDKEEIKLRVAESISFLKPKEQDLIAQLLTNGEKINMIQAESIRKRSEEEELTIAIIHEILNSDKPSASKVKPIKLSSTFLSQYFKPTQKTDEVENIISAALEMYFSAEKNT